MILSCNLLGAIFPSTLREISLSLLGDFAHPAHAMAWGAGPGSLMLIGLGLIATGLFSRIGSAALTRLFPRGLRSL